MYFFLCICDINNFIITVGILHVFAEYHTTIKRSPEVMPFEVLRSGSKTDGVSINSELNSHVMIIFNVCILISVGQTKYRVNPYLSSKFLNLMDFYTEST